MLSITCSVKTRYFEIAVSETVVRVLDLEKLGYTASKLGYTCLASANDMVFNISYGCISFTPLSANISRLWNDTVVIFSSDNGGDPFFRGFNYPLRGYKKTLWEGGVRASAFVHGQMLKRRGVISHDLIHATDWYPTLINLAGILSNCCFLKADLHGTIYFFLTIIACNFLKHVSKCYVACVAGGIVRVRAVEFMCA